MVHQCAKTNAESTDLGRHQHIGTAGRLRTALQGSVVQRSHLVGMVREVGVRTGIVERELTTDEQARLVVAGRERSAESGAGLAMGHVAIGKEYRGFCRETVGNLASLTHETVLHLHAVGDATPARDDAVLADNTRSDVY